MSRLLRLLAVPPALALLAACGGGGGDPAPAPAPSGSATTTASGAVAPATPVRNDPWPVKTRQHLDTWLHGYAMLLDDTTKVPYFRRGYREQMVVRKNAQNKLTALDANRDQLRNGLRARPELVNAQFFPFVASSWEELRQFVEYTVKSDGDPRRVSNPQIAQMIQLTNQYFPTKADREWLRVFMQSLEDERTQFYQLYWITTQRERAGALAATDSLWQRVVRPKLQPFLNANQLASGELLLSLPLEGEGRTVLGGKRTNAIATAYPATREDAAEATYTFVHEAALPLAQTAVGDNVTPNERRAGVADQYTGNAVVLGGYYILQKSLPDMAEGYARFYLRTAGRAVPATGAGAALEREFALPAAIRDAMLRQIDISTGGI